MNDGFYISTYLEIDSLGNIKGLGQRHDHNISLWKKEGENVSLVHYWEFERLSGLKKHKLPFYSKEDANSIINELLKQYNISIDDIKGIWGTPELDTMMNYQSNDEFPEFPYHSIAHMFSALLFNTELFYNDKIIGIAIDGGPDILVDKNSYEKPLYPGVVSNKGDISMFPVLSPGPLWMVAAHYYKEGEGSLMALASATTSEIYIEESEIVGSEYYEDSHKINDYFFYLVNKVDELTAEDVGTLFSGFDPLFSIEDNKISMVMKEIQKMSYRIMDYNIEKIIETYNIDPKDHYIALSGGYILNCPSNAYLMKKYKFKGFIAPPCVSDTGISLGSALYTFYKNMDFFKFNMKHAYYGSEYSNLESIVEDESYLTFVKSCSQLDLNQIVSDIKDAPIVWINNRSEVGPRALGGRSLLADPQSEKAKDSLNVIKQRQWWRPVAPIILEEKMSDWFEESYPSPFMLHTFKIKEDKIDMVPAIKHIDTSARAQTVAAGHNKLLHDILTAFYKDTGVPILCNTSLNDRGEPIIDTLDEALNFSLRKNINIIYFNGSRIELCNHSQYKEEKPLKRPLDIKRKLSDSEEQEALKELNPYNVSDENLFYYYAFPELNIKYSLKNKLDTRSLNLYVNALKERVKSKELITI